MRIGLEFQFDQIFSLFSIFKDQGVRQTFSVAADFVPGPRPFLVVIFSALRDYLSNVGDLAVARFAAPPEEAYRSPKSANPSLRPWSLLLPSLRFFRIFASLAAASNDCDRFSRLETRCR